MANLPVVLIAQNRSLEHTWYVENTVINSGKPTITLTLDSVSRSTGTHSCNEVYNFKKDSSYFNRTTCMPLEKATYSFEFLGAATYGVGTWYFTSANQLVLLSVVNKKTFSREFMLQWINDRKVVLTEK